MKILEPKPPGTLWATPGLQRDDLLVILVRFQPDFLIFLDRFWKNPQTSAVLNMVIEGVKGRTSRSHFTDCYNIFNCVLPLLPFNYVT